MTLAVGIPVLWVTVVYPTVNAVRRNWHVSYSVSKYDIPIGEERVEARKWHVAPGYQTILLRIKAPVATAFTNPSVASVRRRTFRRWKWQYSPELEVVAALDAVNFHEDHEAEPQPGPRFNLASRRELGKGESYWYLVTLLAKESWAGHISFRARLKGTRQATRIPFAVTSPQTPSVVKFVRRWITHGPQRLSVHPLLVPASQSETDSNEE